MPDTRRQVVMALPRALGGGVQQGDGRAAAGQQ
jgi:hypothetical protein